MTNSRGEQESDTDLVAAWCAGDQEAAARLFRRYYDRVKALARTRLGWRLHGVESSADLAQSVFQALFRQCRQQRVAIERQAGLWPLLAAMTVRKARNRHKFYSRRKRDRAREVDVDSLTTVDFGNSPLDIALLKDAVEQLVSSFDNPRRQRIVQLLLEGQRPGEIAQELGTSERTVYKTREAAIEILQAALLQD
jgi:RNA polymerase sigma factor (sigma-70 family)